MLTVVFIAAVPALILAVADLCGMEAVLVVTLELAGRAHELLAVLRLVKSVPAVVLRVAPPPEGDTLVSVGTQELTPATV